MTADEQLLMDYTREGSDAAFGELVTRHIDLVYSSASRVVNGDAQLAQDVTQTVFIDLARKAKKLPPGVMLAGWLYRHTCFAAATAVRTEQRRRHREQAATEMRALDDNTEPAWEALAPHLDEALNQLRPAERDALVRRFLKRQEFRAVGASLGISEDAAQKRVSRALEALRGILAQRGFALTATALASVLAAEAVTAAPAGLVAVVTATSLSAAMKSGAVISTLKIMASAKLKAGMVGAMVLAAVATPWVVHQRANARLREQTETLDRQAVQLAVLLTAHGQLSNQFVIVSRPAGSTSDELNEVLKLRGEIGLLQAARQELLGGMTNQPLSRDEVLASMRAMYLQRVNRLKDFFRDNPAQAVPELQYLTDKDWLEFVEYDHHQIDPDNSHLISSARSSAQIRFAMRVLSNALWQYGKDNPGQFPTDLSQLTPYFKSPVDGSVLGDWAILPMSSLPADMHIDGEWAITQKAPVNAGLDQRVAVGLKGTRLGFGTNQWAVVP